MLWNVLNKRNLSPCFTDYTTLKEFNIENQDSSRTYKAERTKLSSLLHIDQAIQSLSHFTSKTSEPNQEIQNVW